MVRTTRPFSFPSAPLAEGAVNGFGNLAGVGRDRYPYAMRATSLIVSQDVRDLTKMIANWSAPAQGITFYLSRGVRA